jgi:hypothetical protein
MQFANMLPDSLLLPVLPALQRCQNIIKNIIINHLDNFSAAYAAPQDAFLYENLTIGYYLAHSSALVEITNIISIIRQQAPENDVKKITVTGGRREGMLREIFHN